MNYRAGFGWKVFVMILEFSLFLWEFNLMFPASISIYFLFLAPSSVPLPADETHMSSFSRIKPPNSLIFCLFTALMVCNVKTHRISFSLPRRFSFPFMTRLLFFTLISPVLWWKRGRGGKEIDLMGFHFRPQGRKKSRAFERRRCSCLISTHTSQRTVTSRPGEE